ncbi:MAG: hypothetical protein ACE5EX_11305 [Phycisphaerae bacterium]
MKKGLCSGVIGALALCVAGAPALGDIALSFEPVGPPVGLAPGDSLDVAIKVSGLDAYSGPSTLGAFDFNVSFDASVVGLAGVTFGDPTALTGSYLDAFGLGTFTAVTPLGPGSVNLFEFSFDFGPDLDFTQPAMFTVATLSLGAVGAGATDLTLTDVLLSDPDGFALPPPGPGTGPGGVLLGSLGVTVVPLPPAALLGAMGLGLIGWGKRRFGSMN